MPQSATHASTPAGRVFRNQEALLVANGETPLAGTACEEIGALPGIAACALCLEGTVAATGGEEPFPACAAGQSGKPCPAACSREWTQAQVRIPLATAQRNYGALLLRIPDPDLRSQYETRLNAIAAMLALRIENGRQREALRRQADIPARRWDRVFHQSETGIMLIDRRRHVFLAVNEAYAAQRGYTRQELEGSPVDLINPERDRMFSREWILERLVTTGHCTFESVDRRRDGSPIPVLVELTVVRDENGEIESHVGYVQDLTEQKRIQRELKLERDRLALAQQAAHFGSFDLDLITHTLIWSEEMERIYGFGPGEFAGTLEAWAECVVPDERELRWSHVMRDAESGLVGDRFRIRRRDNGDVRWLEASGEIFRDKEGRPARMVGFCVDITDRVHAEEELRQLNATLEHRVRQRTAELQEMNHELEAFAYSVSHDLRAPLRGIDGWSLALVEDYGQTLDADALLYLSRVRSETQRMGRLIDALLELSRLARVRLHTDPVDLSGLVEAIAGRLREENPQRHIAFRIEPEIVSTGDRALLEIALTNLLSNAVKFTGLRGEAAIDFGRDAHQDGTVFYVRDNGAGFDMAHAGMLFGAFQRLHRASEFPGTGIGLATVQRIVHRHGGRIWAASEPDKGATFYFTLGTAYEEADHTPD